MSESTSYNRLEKVVSRAKAILYAIFILVVGPVYLYLNLPVLNIWFTGMPFGIFFISTVVALLELGLLSRKTSIIFKLAASIAVISLFYILIIGISTLPIFRASAYQQLIGEVKVDGDFSKDIASISTDKIRIIDQSVALRLGDKELGNVPALGSQVTIGEFRIQKVKDELYWVAPLLHSGFFKWWTNSKGSPAYIMVSATKEGDAKLVENVNGKPVQVKYQPGAYFGAYLQRHLYFNGCMTTGMTDYTFEINDEGHPFWVVTLYSHAVGFAGANPHGIAIVDAETGEVKKYGIQDAPKWVDRIQPMHIVKTQLDSWGEYVHGYWNFSNQDKLTTTSGMSLVYGHDGQSYWYTGLTSVGRDQGTVGFVLVDTRTKATTWYKLSGATEEAAQHSAEGAVQHLEYYGSFPIMYSINGIPTYVVPLKDKAGLIKMIGMVSVKNHEIVGVGKTRKEALRSYKEALNRSGNDAFQEQSNKEQIEITGIVQRFAGDITGGNSYYYIVINTAPKKVFLGSSAASSEIPITQVGDSVKVFYKDARTALIDISNFDNYNIEMAASQDMKLK